MLVLSISFKLKEILSQMSEKKNQRMNQSIKHSDYFKFWEISNWPHSFSIF